MSEAFLVGDEEWIANVPFRGKWADLYRAVDILVTQPVGARIKVESGDIPQIKKKRLHEYARRQGIGLRSFVTPNWIFANSTKKRAVKSKERGNLAIEEQSAGGVQPTKPAQALSRRAL